MKIIDESKEQCGFEAYRLLSRAYDPLNADTEHVLLSHILALSSWSVKGLAPIASLMKDQVAHRDLREEDEQRWQRPD